MNQQENTYSTFLEKLVESGFRLAPIDAKEDSSRVDEYSCFLYGAAR